MKITGVSKLTLNGKLKINTLKVKTSLDGNIYIYSPPEEYPENYA